MKNTKNKIKLFVNVFFILLLLLISINSATAGNLWDMQSGMDSDTGVGSVFGDTDEPTDLRVLVVNVIKVLLGLLALFFTILIILAGFRWMNSRGNEDEVKKAKEQLKNGIIGIIIIISAYAITLFVVAMMEDMLLGEVI